jgi:hypothetical protein
MVDISKTIIQLDNLTSDINDGYALQWNSATQNWEPKILPSGQSGPQGPPGVIGLSGSVGISGAIGPSGLAGIAGIKGAVGITGPTGDKGNTGDIGAKGPIGNIGETGPLGNPGLPGIIGEIGATGLPGSDGITGPVGDTGDQGPAGYIGAKGPIGNAGVVVGPTGPKGPTGDAGTSVYVNRGLFSMYPPLGYALNPLGDLTEPAAPLVVYDFSKADLSDSAANNVANANKSGNSAYNLTVAGTPTFEYALVHQVQDSGNYSGLTTSIDGYTTAIVTGGLITDGAWSSTGTDLALTGAMTIEGLFSFDNTFSGINGVIEYGAAGETEDTNFLYRFGYDGGWKYFAESGAGVDINAAFATLTSPGDKGTLFCTFMRNSSGHVRLYINGCAVSDWVIPTSTGSIIPSGGSSAVLKINPRFDGFCIGVRIFNYVLTNAQIIESYRHTMFGN